MTHWFTQSWIWCWGTARATNNVGTSENTRCHRKCELLNLWWKVSLAHVWGREHTQVYLEILFGDFKWDNEMWDVHKTVCILDRFLSPMCSSPTISRWLEKSTWEIKTYLKCTLFYGHLTSHYLTWNLQIKSLSKPVCVLDPTRGPKKLSTTDWVIHTSCDI